MEPTIIFEDAAILVVNKPAGWIVNEAESAKGQTILQTWLSAMNYPLAKSREFRSGIVHRLDKETSGVLVVAKTKEAFNKLQRQFKTREVQKTYLALAHGVVEPGEGVIEAPLGRLPWRRDRFGVLPGGRESRTDYRSISNYKFLISNVLQEFTLLELSPKTGRTHQIRVHLKHIGHAIVADESYAGRKTARHDRKWCPRLFLHAFKIEFTHPVLGKRVSFEAELPQDLKSALESLTS